MDMGPLSQRRYTKRKRVLSPNAAKTAAETFGRAIGVALRILRKMFLDQLYH